MRHIDQLTLRKLDPEVQRKIRTLAKTEGISLNKAALRLLEKGAGINPRTRADRIGDSLDHLIGTWTKAQANELLETIQGCEQIDTELWR